jgi:formate dehydrogenase assembly factor FdhD
VSEEATSWGKPARSLTGKSVQAVLGTGAADIAAAGKAVAAGIGSGAFSVDPAVVDSMIKKLRDIKDVLSELVNAKAELTADTKLGGGYAQTMSQLNKQFGESATKQVVDTAKAIQSLIDQVEKSRASYQNADQAHAASLKNLNGTS